MAEAKSRYQILLEETKKMLPPPLNDEEEGRIDTVLRKFTEAMLTEFPAPVKLINYYIQEMPSKSSLWLEHKSGEGMQTSKREFEKVVHKYYNRNF